MPSRVGVLGAAAIVAAFASQPAAQEGEVELSPADARALSADLLASGDPGRAAMLADALLDRDPDDAAALVLRARAALTIDDFNGARYLATRAYETTDIPRARYVAARIVALSHAGEGNDTRAQFWLRRARQYAPDAQAAADVAADYDAVSRRNPLAFQLRFGITPTSNVNNGSVKSEVNLFGFTDIEGNPILFELDGAAKALSGLQYNAGVSARYRLEQSERAITYLDASLDLTTYTLSDSARDQAPGATGSDFSDASVSLGFTHRRILAEGANPTTFTAEAGQSWYGGDPYTGFQVLGASHSWDVGDRGSFGVQGSVRRTTYLDDDPGVDADITRSITLRYAHILPRGDRVAGSLGYWENDSEILSRDYDAGRVTASYDLAQPLGPVGLGFDVGFEQRHYDSVPLAGGASRTDDVLSAGVSARFTNIEYYGFQPVVRLDAQRTESTLDLYDRETVSVSLDFVSAF